MPLKRTASKQRQALIVMLMLTDAFGSEQKKAVQQDDTVDKHESFIPLAMMKMTLLDELFSFPVLEVLPTFSPKF